MQRLCTFLLFAAIFITLFVGFFHPVSAINQDLGRHILTGQIILKTHTVPKINLFSYTYPDFPFINHHYLSEVVYAALVPFIHISGLLWLNVLLIMTTVLLLIWRARKEASIVPIAFVSLLYLGILFERTDVRPEIFSFFFLSCFIVILFRYRETFTRWIFLLIPLELLWANMHIYFPIGVGVVALFFLEEAMMNRKNLRQKHTVVLGFVLLLCCLATLFNPHGFAGATYPLHVFQNYGYTIEENQTIFFLEGLGIARASFLFFKLSVVLLFLSLLFAFKNARWIDWLLAISFTIIAGMAVRNFPLFVLATFLVFTRSLSWVYDHVISFLTENKPAISSWLLPMLTFLLLAGFYLTGKSALARNHFGDTIPEEARNGVNFLLAHNIRGPLFNNFDIGSYLEYRLYPKEHVFVDGRPEAYPASFFQNVYIPMQQDQAIFARVANQYHFNVIFFSHADQTPWAGTFLKDILHNSSWKTVYLDPYTIILLKDTPANQALINTYAPRYKEFAMSALPTNDEIALLHAANFYRVVALTDQEKQMYNRILSLDPGNCAVLGNMLLLTQLQQDPLTSLYQQRFQKNCQ